MDQIAWYRIKNAARRCIKSRMRLAVCQTTGRILKDWADMVRFEEMSVKESREAFSQLMASFGPYCVRPELRGIIQRALDEAAQHTTEHFEELGMKAKDQVQAFTTDFQNQLDETCDTENFEDLLCRC